MLNFIIVGLGGGLGAIGRYAVGLLPYKGTFPVLTLLINLFGAVLIGFAVCFASKRGISEKWILFLKTGVCGGFTTFSTFSLEALNLFQKGKYTMCVIYVFLSVTLCIVGVLAGQRLAVYMCKG